MATRFVTEQQIVKVFREANTKFIIIYFEDYVTDKYGKVNIKPIGGKILNGSEMKDLSYLDLKHSFPDLEFIKAPRNVMGKIKPLSKIPLKLIITCEDQEIEINGKKQIYHKCRVNDVKNMKMWNEELKRYEEDKNKWMDELASKCDFEFNDEDEI